MEAGSRCDELRNPGFVNLVISMQVPVLLISPHETQC